MENTTNKELSITRIINAPREFVFKAWIESEQLTRWWGPKGFTSIVHIWNPTPGGEILIDMISPDEIVYPMDGKFLEIIPNEKIVFTSAALDDKQERLFEVKNTITFIEESGKTKLALHFIFSNIKPEGLKDIAGAETGWNMSLDRLNNYLNNSK